MTSHRSQSQLFTQKKQSSTRFLLAILLSFVILLSDTHYNQLGGVRLSLTFLVAPLQYAVDYPVRVWHGFSAMVSAKKTLIDENVKLHYQQTVLEAQLQKLKIIRKENAELKQLLSAATNANTHAMAAQILAVDTSTNRQLLVLNKGKRDGVYVGQPVLDAKGIMGQIVDVGSMTSTMLMISDGKSAVPVQNNRTGERAILVGTNTVNQLSLINSPKTSSINAGDLLVTSGLGRRYPEGYPVGIVKEVINTPGEEFSKVIVAPLASLNSSHLVLLIWPGEEHAELTEQINQRLHALDGLA